MGVLPINMDDIMSNLYNDLEEACEVLGFELIEVEVPVKKWYQFWK